MKTRFNLSIVLLISIILSSCTTKLDVCECLDLKNALTDQYLLSEKERKEKEEGCKWIYEEYSDLELIQKFAECNGSNSDDATTVTSNLDQELKRWSKDWVFDSYIENSVVVLKSENLIANACFLVNDGIVANDTKYEGIHSQGYFYVKRFSSKVKTNFESFIFYKGNRKIVRICYQDNMEQRCNHSALTE